MNIIQEYEILLDRFNKAFNYKYEENSKADIEFKKIIKRLAEIEKQFKEGKTSFFICNNMSKQGERFMV